MKKQIFLGVLLLFWFGGLRSSEIRYDKDTIKLDLSEQKVTDEQLQKIAKTCPNLETLNLNYATGFTHLGVQDVLDKCINLTYFSLWYCKIDFEELNGYKFKNLGSLSLAYSTITDKGLQNIVKNGLTVWNLDLDTTEIRGEEVDWRKLSNLEHLILSHSKITDKGLEKISTACKNLYYLEISYTNITDTGVQHILEKCVNLTKLYLYGCENIDFTKLNWGKLNKFETLYLGGPAVTEAGLQKILVCPSLKYLNLEGCENLRKEWQRIFDGKEDIQKLREQLNPFPDFARAFSAIF